MDTYVARWRWRALPSPSERRDLRSAMAQSETVFHGPPLKYDKSREDKKRIDQSAARGARRLEHLCRKAGCLHQSATSGRRPTAIPECHPALAPA